MNTFEQLQLELRTNPRTWLVTGVAGFIGCNLLRGLQSLGQNVVGVDNLSTGSRANLDEVTAEFMERDAGHFRFIEGDIRDLDTCREAVQGVDYVLHEAALGSVPRSLDDPIRTNQSNIDGFLNMLVAARDANVKRFVYAASSSTYGDSTELPKVEDRIGKPLSPYAVTKYVNELYAGVFARSYGFRSIGLRYFNVFGPNQSPEGAYAAVIPKWIAAMLRGDPVFINGDGSTSRDFCYVENVVQANLLAATTANDAALDQVFNIACGDRTTLNELYTLISAELLERVPRLELRPLEYHDFRRGDTRHSLANIDKARHELGYEPRYRVAEGMRRAMDWYVQELSAAPSPR